MKKLFNWIKKTINEFKSVRGLISLFISFMIFYGWLLIFIVIGIVSDNAWFYGVGIGGVVFWFGPGTPLIPLIIGVATFIRKFILRDSDSDSDSDKDDKDGKEKDE